MTTKEVGDMAEEIAAEYLASNGCRVLDKKFSYKQLGEVDIIVEEGKEVVFVEVRFRTSTVYGTPEESLRPGKLRKIRRTALMWLTINGRTRAACRFDVIAIDLVGGEPVIRHLRNAF